MGESYVALDCPTSPALPQSLEKGVCLCSTIATQLGFTGKDLEKPCLSWQCTVARAPFLAEECKCFTGERIASRGAFARAPFLSRGVSSRAAFATELYRWRALLDSLVW